MSFWRRIISQAFVPQIVRDQARRERSIVHGAQSINAQVLPFLRRPTRDYDLFETNPRMSALRLERRLDREAGGNEYRVIPGQHRGTFKVKRIATDTTVADYTRPEVRVPTRMLDGMTYSTLGFEAKRKRVILAKREFAYRHEKAQQDLNRIRLNRKLIRV